MTAWWPRHEVDEIEAVARVLISGRTNYWTGTEGQSFEREYAQFVGVEHAIAVSNGTVALEVALRALRLPPGSEVIVPARTFVACAAACVTVGLKPVLADVGHDLNVSVHTIRQRLRRETSAVMVVHYAGLPVADLEEIVSECSGRRVSVIEDCAHAHGAKVGLLGDIACWSFCQGKIISTGGEGGMVTTASGLLAERVRAFRDHGRFQMIGNAKPGSAPASVEDERRTRLESKAFSYTVKEFGSNLRMTEMQSAIGRVQLRKLPAWLARRQEIAAAYDAVTGGSVAVDRIKESALYMYLWRAQGLKPALLERVREARWGGCANIGKEPAFRAPGPAGGQKPCTDADALGEDVVSLPVYPTMTDDDVAVVCDEVRAVLRAAETPPVKRRLWGR